MGSLRILATVFALLTLLCSAGAQMFCNTFALDQTTRQVILALHNALRTHVAVGAARPAPSGQNIYALTYNCSLEESAQKVANKCPTSNSDPSERPNMGENIYVYNGPAVTVAAFKRAYVEWQSARGWTPRQTVFTSALNANGLRNFAQMAWGSTTLVGCGYKQCGSFQSVVCHYMTAGAIVDQPAYQLGRGCVRSEECTTFSSSTCDIRRRLCVAPIGESLAPPATSATTTAPAQLTCDGVASILTPTIRTNIILGKHNRIRGDLVKGRKVGGVFKRGTSKMFQMKYDCALENSAHIIADSSSMCSSDEALNSTDGGRNVYVSNATFTTAGNIMLDAINTWISEIEYFNDNNIMGTGPQENDLQKMGRFAQMAFWKTTAVGCSIGRCNATRTVVVCRYKVARTSTGRVYVSTSFTNCLDSKCKEGYTNATCDTTSGLCQLP